MKSMTKREKAATTVAAIRAQYPNPVIGSAIKNPTEYCVRGAVYKYDQKIFNHLEADASCAIVRANDQGDFEAAWNLVEDALAQE